MTAEADSVFRQKAFSRGLILQLLMGCVEWCRQELAYCRTMRALSQLDERGLRDIGLQRTIDGYEWVRDPGRK